MKLKIYLFRHGLTHYNEHHWFTGQIDSRMNSAGRRNAQKIAHKLAHKKIDAAYHSGLSRSRETLNIVLCHHPECKSVVEDKRLMERSYGKLQRHSHKEFMRELERTILPPLERKYGRITPHARCVVGHAVAERIYEMYHRSYDIPPPGGESIKMVEKRVLAFIQELLRRMKKEKVNVAIAAHGNSMRPFRRYFEKLSIEQMMRLDIPFDDYFEYTVEV